MIDHTLGIPGVTAAFAGVGPGYRGRPVDAALEIFVRKEFALAAFGTAVSAILIIRIIKRSMTVAATAVIVYRQSVFTEKIQYHGKLLP